MRLAPHVPAKEINFYVLAFKENLVDLRRVRETWMLCAMKPLTFLCPRTGNEVDAGIDLDAKSFASLIRDITELSCPHCPEPHVLAGVSAWLGELHKASLSR